MGPHWTPLPPKWSRDIWIAPYGFYFWTLEVKNVKVNLYDILKYREKSILPSLWIYLIFQALWGINISQVQLAVSKIQYFIFCSFFHFFKLIIAISTLYFIRTCFFVGVYLKLDWLGYCSLVNLQASSNRFYPLSKAHHKDSDD